MQEIQNIKVLRAAETSTAYHPRPDSDYGLYEDITAVTLDGKTLDQIEKINGYIGVDISDVRFHKITDAENGDKDPDYSLSYDMIVFGNEISSRSMKLTQEEGRQIEEGIKECREDILYSKMTDSEEIEAEKPKIVQDKHIKGLVYQIWEDSAGACYKNESVASVDLMTGEYKTRDDKNWGYLPEYKTTSEAVDFFKEEVRKYVSEKYKIQDKKKTDIDR